MKITVNLPESLHRRIEFLAADDGITIDQFVTVAVAEKLSAHDTLKYLQERAERGNPDDLLEILAKVPDVEPEPYDRFTAPKS